MNELPAPKLPIHHYRIILLFIWLFLVINMAVVVPGVFLSEDMQQDAVSINLAGRQSLLLQRIVKALVQMQYAHQHHMPITSEQQELATTFQVFDQTLHSFANGGEAVDDDNQRYWLSAVIDPIAQQHISKAQTIWQLYRKDLYPLLNGQMVFSSVDLQTAIDYALEYNLTLLDLMSNFTLALERLAHRKAVDMQWILGAGILMMGLGFIFLISYTGYVLHRLRQRDIDLQMANQAINHLNIKLQQENERVHKERRSSPVSQSPKTEDVHPQHSEAQ